MTHTCTNCQTINSLPQAIQWEAFACISCGSYFVKQNAKVVPIKKFQDHWDYPSKLRIGDKATINGEEWQITGYSKQETIPGAEVWHEYYLLNTSGKQQFLSVYEDQWMLAEETNEAREQFAKNDGVTTHEGTYRLESEEEFETICAVGFFKDAIPTGRRVSKDFSCPPYSMLLEIDDDGIHQYRAKSISVNELRTIFQESRFPGEPVFTEASLPDHSEAKFLFFFELESPGESAGICLITALFISILFLFQPRNTNIASLTIKLEHHKDTSTVSQVFELNDKTQMMVIEASTHLSNNWAEVGSSLTNIETGEEYYITEEASYYSGIEDLSTWSEGSNSTYLKFCGIPKGKYVASLYGYSPINTSISALVINGGRSTIAYYIAIGTMIVLFFAIIDYEQKSQESNTTE